MKKLLFLCCMLCFSLLTLNINGQTWNDILTEYGQNPAKAIEKYMNKAVVTVTFCVNNMDSTHYLNGGVDIFSYRGIYSSFFVCEGLTYTDAIKIDLGDSIRVRGLISGSSYSFKGIGLKKAKLIGIVYKDSDRIKRLQKQNACSDCDTSMKIYHDFITAYELNPFRARRDYFNKPFTFYVQVSRFASDTSGINFPYQLNRGGIGCVWAPISEEQLKQGGSRGDGDITLEGRPVCIVVYGLSIAESTSLKANQRFKVKGLLTESPTLHSANMFENAFNMITLYKCSIVK